MSGARARLIALGNPLRRDDGAGPEVARRVLAARPAGVGVVELDGDPGDLLEAWRGAELAVVVDTVCSGGVPGTVHRLEVRDGLGVPDRPRRDSSHELGLGDLVELARALGRLPARLVVIGIEAAELGPGAGLSAPVAAAVERVALMVLDELRAPAA